MSSWLTIERASESFPSLVFEFEAPLALAGPEMDEEAIGGESDVEEFEPMRAGSAGSCLNDIGFVK